MLSNEQLDIILKKDKLKLEDLILIEDHLLFIAKIEKEYLYLPEDVVLSLNRDVELILKVLQEQRKPRLKLLKNEE